MARLGATASKPWKSFATIKLTHCPLAINPTDAVAVGNRCSRTGVECRRHRSVGHRPHPGTQRAHGRKVLDSEPDRLRRGRKTTVAQRLSCPALALAHEQLGR